MDPPNVAGSRKWIVGVTTNRHLIRRRVLQFDGEDRMINKATGSTSRKKDLVRGPARQEATNGMLRVPASYRLGRSGGSHRRTHATFAKASILLSLRYPRIGASLLGRRRIRIPARPRRRGTAQTGATTTGKARSILIRIRRGPETARGWVTRKGAMQEGPGYLRHLGEHAEWRRHQA